MSTELATVSSNSLPDYLKDLNEPTGLEGFGKEDVKLPRLKIIQGMSPEVRSHPGQAIPGQIWHTALNKSLGTSIKVVPLAASKKVFVWLPRKDGGDMVAISNDSVSWIKGANTSHKVPSIGKDVVWNIGANVKASHLLDFGTSNPSDEKSSPAATLIYEYLVYLPDYPEYGVAALSMSKTALNAAKGFNTALMILNKPINCINVNVSTIEQSSEGNTWFVPKLETNGFVSREIFDKTTSMKKAYAEYKVEYDETETDVTAKNKTNGTTTLKDEIPF